MSTRCVCRGISFFLSDEYFFFADEFRMHLQRNFMIWYKEEQHLKEQLRYVNVNRSLLLLNRSISTSL